MVAVIESPFARLLVAAAGRLDAGASSRATAVGRAVDVSAIAGRADREGLGTAPAGDAHEAQRPRGRSAERAASTINGQIVGQ